MRGGLKELEGLGGLDLEVVDTIECDRGLVRVITG